MLISGINTKAAGEHFFGKFLQEAGFVLTALGYQMRRAQHPIEGEREDLTELADEGDAEESPGGQDGDSA